MQNFTGEILQKSGQQQDLWPYPVMTSTNNDDNPQVGWTSDHRMSIGGACWQPWTSNAAANKGRWQRPLSASRYATRGIQERKKKFITIFAYNVRSLNNEIEKAGQLPHLDNFLLEIKKLKWDIFGLSETKLQGNFTEAMPDGHLLFNSGVARGRKRSGVGFLVNKKLTNSVLEFKPITERLAYIKLRGRTSNILIIQCYFPTTQGTDEEVDELYAKLQEVIDSNPKRDQLIVLGDFNCKVGGLHSMNREVVGNHNNIKSGHNQRGIKLLNFCSQNMLSIANTFFKHRRKITWVSPGGIVKNTIDYVLVKTNSLNKVLDAAVLGTPDISDHKPVRLKMSLEYKVKKDMTEKRYKFDFKKLENHEIKAEYQQKITASLENFNDNQNPNVVYKKVQNTLLATSLECLGKKKRQANEEWITSETLKAVDLKKDIRRKHGSNSIIYKLHKNNVKRLCRIDKEKSIDEQHKRIQDQPASQQYFETIKKMKNKKKP